MSNTHPTMHRETTTKRRKASWLAAFFALALPLAVLTAPSAQAGTTPPFTIGPPNAAVVPGVDADQTLPDPFGSGQGPGARAAELQHDQDQRHPQRRGSHARSDEPERAGGPA